MDKKFRQSKSRREIVGQFEKLLKEQANFSLWQKNIDGTRHMLKSLSFHSVYPDEGLFTLNLPLAQLTVDPAKDFYFYIEDSDALFKTRTATEQKQLATFMLPKEMQLKEKRQFDRNYFDLEDKQSVDIKFTKQDGGITEIYQCPLLNISSGGAGFLLSLTSAKGLDLKSDLWVKTASIFRTARVRNLRPFSAKGFTHDEMIAVGVEFIVVI